MTRGPQPDPKARRRNAPTIPTTDLPASGRSGRSPTPPKWLELGPAGKAWWSWAWHTPQAAAWGDSHGAELTVARRAMLEDDLAALAAVRGLDFDELCGAESHSEFKAMIRSVAGLATGRLQVMKEMRELDDRLGLTPKARQQMRWAIVDDSPNPEEASGDDEVASRRERRKRLAGA